LREKGGFLELPERPDLPPRSVNSASALGDLA